MLVSVGDVRRYLGGVPIQDGMQVELENVISRAQKVVETYLNRPVEKVQIREVQRSDSKGFVYLSVTPAWKILSCGSTTAQSVPDTLETYTITPDPSLGDDPRIIDKVPNAILSGPLQVWPGRLYTGVPNKSYIVEYIGGLDPAQIDDVKRVIVQMAAREWAMYNVDSGDYKAGSLDMTEAQDNRGLNLSSEEKQAIQRYRRRVAL
jgi:hypothetical protein